MMVKKEVTIMMTVMVMLTMMMTTVTVMMTATMMMTVIVMLTVMIASLGWVYLLVGRLLWYIILWLRLRARFTKPN